MLHYEIMFINDAYRRQNSSINENIPLRDISINTESVPLGEQENSSINKECPRAQFYKF